MSAIKAIQDFLAILRNIPAAAIAPDRIGYSGPAQAPDLPRVAVALGPVREAPIGIGGVAGMAFDGAQWTSLAGTRTSGVLQVEIWAAGAPQMNPLVDTVLATVAASVAALAASGFAAFETQAIRAAEGVLLADSTTALRATLEFSIVHEDIAALVTGPGGAIKEIDVDIDGQFNEHMTLK